MKQILSIILTLSVIFSYGQEYSFAREYAAGKVVLKNSSVLEGELKWYPSQNDKLSFRTNEKEKATKYTPDDLISFSSQNMKFVPLNNFTAFADSYAMIGKPTKIEDTFGEVISEGKFNIYFISVRGYNAILRTAEDYQNFVFQDSADPEKKLYAYPYMIRMKEKKY